MTTTFSDLIADVTEAAVYELVRTAGEIVELDFDKMPPNGVVRTLAKSVFSKVLYRCFGSIVPTIARGGFLDFAPDGPWLEALGEQFYDTERIKQTFATTTVTFENTSANVYNFAEGQVIVQHGVSKKTYRCAAFSIREAGAPDDGDEATVSVTAIEPGSASSADADDIDAITTQFEGLSITGSATATGTDLETAAAYIARCRLAAGATSPAGAVAAYEYVALSATRDDGTPIGITRVSVDADNPDGEVMVYVADPDGVVAGDDVDRVEELLLEQVVPHGVDFQGVSSATAVTVNVTYSATALRSSGLTEEEIEVATDDALGELMAVTPIGGWDGFLRAAKLRGTIVQVEGLAGRPRPLIDVTMTVPAADVALDVDEVPIKGTVSGTIAFLDD